MISFIVNILKNFALVCVLISVVIKLMVLNEYHQTTMNELEDLSGKVAIVTGANSGLGFETAKQLASAGAKVILACRNMKKCQRAKDKIISSNVNIFSKNIVPMTMDLSDLKSVRQFANMFLENNSKLHYLFNNAAIMMGPYQSFTKYNIEAQHAVNHIGHFALTGLLFEVLEKTKNARVINHSSIMNNRCNTLFVEKLAFVTSKHYEPSNSYGCTKRANRYFTWSLNNRFKNTIATICHPGWSSTSLQVRATGYTNLFGLFPYVISVLNNLFAQPVDLGAHPQLFAALNPDLEGGELIGPKFIAFGAPVIETVKPCDLGFNLAKFKRETCEEKHLEALWKQSEELSGVKY